MRYKGKMTKSQTKKRFEDIFSKGLRSVAGKQWSDKEGVGQTKKKIHGRTAVQVHSKDKRKKHQKKKERCTEKATEQFKCMPL